MRSGKLPGCTEQDAQVFPQQRPGHECECPEDTASDLHYGASPGYVRLVGAVAHKVDERGTYVSMIDAFILVRTFAAVVMK